MIKNHTELLQYLAGKINAKTYLEIGVSNPVNNFDKIPVAHKVGVDPNPKAQATYCMTSDEYFLHYIEELPLRLSFDLIFIDGLHHADQVKRDFENSLKVLNEGGLIVLHDTCPDKEKITHVPRDRPGRWLGDVYKFASTLSNYNVNYFTLDIDNGCTVVRKIRAEEVDIWQTGGINAITWDIFKANKKKLLNIISVNDLGKMFA